MSSRFERFLLDELWRAYEVARKGKRKTVDEHRFEINDMENIRLLRDSIIRRAYHPNRGVAFIVHDPVTREIVAAPFRDRVVHHFLYNLSAKWWDRRFCPDSYSCRDDKGVLYGQQRLAHHIRIVTQNYTQPAFAVTLDIQSYFISLSHKKLYARVLWGLDHQFQRGADPQTLPYNYFQKNQIHCHPYDRDTLYQTAKFLWHQIIYDDPMTGITIRGSRKDWSTLPYHKSLFNRRPGHGIVIGNLTSQLLSNIYLDQLDRFITIDLGYKHYGRYVDDFYIIVPMSQKHQIMRDISVISQFLHRLDLTLHPRKIHTQPVDKGIPFIGAVIYPGFIVPGHRARRKAHAAAYKLSTCGEGTVEGFVAREGTLLHINACKFFKQIFDRFGWDYGWDPDSFPSHASIIKTPQNSPSNTSLPKPSIISPTTPNPAKQPPLVLPPRQPSLFTSPRISPPTPRPKSTRSRHSEISPDQPTLFT